MLIQQNVTFTLRVMSFIAQPYNSVEQQKKEINVKIR